MVLFTILTDGQHPYGLTGRKETAQVAMKVNFVYIIYTVVCVYKDTLYRNNMAKTYDF